MHRHSIVFTACLIMVFTSLAALAMGADDPQVGNWKQTAPNTGMTMKIEGQENGLKFVGSEGTQWSAKYDGKDYPYGGSKTVDTITLNKIDAKTLEMIGKKGGKEVERRRVVVSKDGKIRTVTTQRKDPNGQETTTRWL